MKKILLASAAALTLGVGAYSAYAADGPATNRGNYDNPSEYVEEYGPQYRRHGQRNFNNDQERFNRFEGTREERDAFREERIQDALRDGRITEDEAAHWRQEIKERDDYADEYGYSNRGHHGGRRHHDDRRNFGRNGSRHCGY